MPLKLVSSKTLHLMVSTVLDTYNLLVGLYEVDIGFGADDNGDVMAFADLDSDKYTDIIIVP